MALGTVYSCPLLPRAQTWGRSQGGRGPPPLPNPPSSGPRGLWLVRSGGSCRGPAAEASPGGCLCWGVGGHMGTGARCPWTLVKGWSSLLSSRSPGPHALMDLLFLIVWRGRLLDWLRTEGSQGAGSQCSAGPPGVRRRDGCHLQPSSLSVRLQALSGSGGTRCALSHAAGARDVLLPDPHAQQLKCLPQPSPPELGTY